MKLDSVRELKHFALSQNDKAFYSEKNITLTTVCFGKITSPVNVAIGIAKKGNEYVLAVRVPSRKAKWYNKFIEYLDNRVKNEYDLKVCPQIKAFDDDTMWRQKRTRPLMIGSSIGHPGVTAGTLGSFAKNGNKVYILSNNHVIANQNDAKPGDAISQPGSHDGGKIEKDSVAELSKFVKLEKSGNKVDGAIALVDKNQKYDASTITGVGKLKGSCFDIEIGEPVFKFGRTTGSTKGTVTAIEVDNLRVMYGQGVLSFDNQIEIQGSSNGPFSLGGDSGSMIVNGDHKAVALLFAGGSRGNGKDVTYANYMKNVCEALNIEILY